MSRERSPRRPARHDTGVVLVVGVAAGVGVVAAGPSPTGSTVVDAVVVIVAVVAVVWAASEAPWWAGVAAAVVATALAPSLPLMIVGLAGAAVGAMPSTPTRDRPAVRALVIGLTLQVLARVGDLSLPFGVSAAIVISVCLTLSILGIARRPRRQRAAAALTVGAVLVGALLALSGGGLAAAAASGAVRDGVDAAQRAVDQLADGDLDGARASFHEAAALLDRGDRALGRPWSQPVRLVPVAAQYRSAGTQLVGTAATVAADVADALDRIDPDALRVRGGAIDVSAVEALAEPVAQLLDALDALADTSRSIDDPWLSDRLTDRLDELAARIETERPKGDDALEVVEQLPLMLGSDGPRRYFVAFTTPVESRGVGGLLGNWAEVTIDRGRISFTGFGRNTDLNEAGSQPKRITGPRDFLDTWGDRGFQRVDVAGRTMIWNDVTMSPNFPAVGQVIAELYPQSGGGELDGAFAMDVDTIAALMTITGPVDVPQAGITLSSDNAAEYLLRDQYLVLDTPDRVDALEVVARTTMERLLTSDLPSPIDLAKLLAPFMREGRLVAWSAHQPEQTMLHELAVDGALPEADGTDAMAVVLNNAGNNKIDYFLDGRITHDVTTAATNAGAASRNEVMTTTTVDLVNGAPASGLPDYVIANYSDLPRGTNHLYITVYTALPVSGATVDGRRVPVRSSIEAGLHTASLFVAIPPGGSTRVVVTSVGTVNDPAAFVRSVALRSPPAVRPLPIEVTIDGVPATGTPVRDSGLAVVGDT